MAEKLKPKSVVVIEGVEHDPSRCIVVVPDGSGCRDVSALAAIVKVMSALDLQEQERVMRFLEDKFYSN